MKHVRTLHEERPRCLVHTQQDARELGQRTIGVPELLISLTEVPVADAAVLAMLGIDLEEVRGRVEELLGRPELAPAEAHVTVEHERRLPAAALDQTALLGPALLVAAHDLPLGMELEAPTAAPHAPVACDQVRERVPRGRVQRLHRQIRLVVRTGHGVRLPHRGASGRVPARGQRRRLLRPPTRPRRPDRDGPAGDPPVTRPGRQCLVCAIPESSIP
jgi:hypothetical protein